MSACGFYWAAALGVAAALLGGCGGSPQGSLAIDGGTEVMVADLDGDGRRDILALTYQFGDQPHQGLLTVRRQTQQGHFAAAEIYVVGCYPWSLVLADVDGDGHADLIVTDVSYTGCADPTAGKALYFLRQDPTPAGPLPRPSEADRGRSHVPAGGRRPERRQRAGHRVR